MKKSQKSSKKSSNSWISAVAGIVAFVIGAAVVQAYPATFGVAIVLAVCSGLGYWFGSWYAKRPKQNKGFLKFLFWSNVITWFIPAIGFMTSAATLRLNRDNKGKDRQQFMVIAWACFGLSVANGIAGAAKLLG